MAKQKPKRRGHPVLFDGPREKMSIKVTTTARALIRSTQAWLKARGYGHAATEAAAVEYLVRKATRTGLRLPPAHRIVPSSAVRVLPDLSAGADTTPLPPTA